MKATPYQQELNELHAKINDLEKKHEKTLLILSDRLHLAETTLVKHDQFLHELKETFKLLEK